VLDMQRQNEQHTQEVGMAISGAVTEGVRMVMFGDSPTHILHDPGLNSGKPVTDVDTSGAGGQEWERPGWDEGLDIDPQDGWADVNPNDRAGRAVTIRPGEDPLAGLGVLPRDMSGEGYPDPEEMEP
jgi:hypothetical protein